MPETRQSSGSAARWGPLFGARAQDWAETWEGAAGWGAPVYEHVLDRAGIGSGTRVLDCGCGAGRFVRLAADRGAEVAGIDAAAKLVEIAAGRAPEAGFRVGDLEALPWADGSFDVVTGFSSFQFADDHVKALAEARRVSRGSVVVVIPSLAAESGIAAVFTPLLPLFPAEARAGFAQSGIFALSGSGRLDDVLGAAELTVRDDDEIACPVVFDKAVVALRAFTGAGPTQLAIRHSGESAVVAAVREALGPFTGSDGRITLPGAFRVVLAHG